MKLSTLALALGMAFTSSAAFAVTEQWDSATPWGTATPAFYAEWNQYAFPAGIPVVREDNSPDILAAGSVATLKETSGTGFVAGSGNIYSFSGTTAFTTTLNGNAGDTYDVYLRVAGFGTLPSQVASLNGTTANATVAFSGLTDSSFGTVDEAEYFWKWTVTGSSLYTFNFAALGPHMSLDQVALAVVATTTTVTPVPEPEAYGMMMLGLGLVTLATRRSRKNKA